MVRARLGRLAANVLMVAMLVARRIHRARQRKGQTDMAALNKQVAQLYGQGKYKEAAAIAEKALALAGARAWHRASRTLAS